MPNTGSLLLEVRKMVMDAFQESLSKVVDITENVRSYLGALNDELAVIKETQHKFNTKLDFLQRELQAKKSSVEEIKEAPDQPQLTNIHMQLAEVTRKINWIEQSKFEADVIISNVSQIDENEHTQTLLEKLTTHCGLLIDPAKIKFCSRMKSKSVKTISPIVVRFTDGNSKNTFLKTTAGRILYDHSQEKGARRRIYVQQRFSSTYYQIHRATRGIVAAGKHSAWYSRGTFFLQHRKEPMPIEVRSLDDIPHYLRKAPVDSS